MVSILIDESITSYLRALFTGFNWISVYIVCPYLISTASISIYMLYTIFLIPVLMCFAAVIWVGYGVHLMTSLAYKTNRKYVLCYPSTFLTKFKKHNKFQFWFVTWNEPKISLVSPFSPPISKHKLTICLLRSEHCGSLVQTDVCVCVCEESSQDGSTPRGSYRVVWKGPNKCVIRVIDSKVRRGRKNKK